MSYFGYVEVEVRLLRQGHGTDSSGEAGSGFAVEQKKVIRVEEADARTHVEGAAGQREISDKLRDLIRDVLDMDDMDDLQRRWRDATDRMTPSQMREALKVLEGR